VRLKIGNNFTDATMAGFIDCDRFDDEMKFLLNAKKQEENGWK
jgi:hypothetical protein